MSYHTSYKHFTRKQCNVIFKAFKSGQLTPPKDCCGKVKRDGFVYSFENYGYRQGMYTSKDDQLFNAQLAALEKCVSLVIGGELVKAQAILDGVDETFNRDWLPSGIEPRKMWKQVF